MNNPGLLAYNTLKKEGDSELEALKFRRIPAHPAQQESLLTSLSNVCAASLRASALVK